jgi:hypothetical protein
MADAKKILKEYWKRMLYAIVLMALFNYVGTHSNSHTVIS